MYRTESLVQYFPRPAFLNFIFNIILSYFFLHLKVYANEAECKQWRHERLAYTFAFKLGYLEVRGSLLFYLLSCLNLFLICHFKDFFELKSYKGHDHTTLHMYIKTITINVCTDHWITVHIGIYIVLTEMPNKFVNLHHICICNWAFISKCLKVINPIILPDSNNIAQDMPTPAIQHRTAALKTKRLHIFYGFLKIWQKKQTP